MFRVNNAGISIEHVELSFMNRPTFPVYFPTGSSGDWRGRSLLKVQLLFRPLFESGNEALLVKSVLLTHVIYRAAWGRTVPPNNN